MQDVFLSIFILPVQTAGLTGVEVYHSRILAGKALAESYPVEADPCGRGAGFGAGSSKGIFRVFGHSVWNGIS